jgi:hypothetical protein
MKSVLFLTLLTMLIAPMIAHSDDVEASRTYGKMYVAPIRVGEFPPVCVTQHIAGPLREQGINAMRDPQRPYVLVFCKDVNPEAAALYRALDSLTAYGAFPCTIVVTDRKGVAPTEAKGFDPALYYTAEAREKRFAALKQQAARVGLSEPSLDIAVNRFWHDSLGYAENSDIVVAYVRGTVVFIEPLNSRTLTPQQVRAVLKKIGESHRRAAVSGATTQ